MTSGWAFHSHSQSCQSYWVGCFLCSEFLFVCSQRGWCGFGVRVSYFMLTVTVFMLAVSFLMHTVLYLFTRFLFVC